MDMKYKITSETKVEFDITLNRIEALKDFGLVSKGDKGGWIENEENLNQDGNAWVYGDAQVYGDARVYGDAQVYGKLKLSLGYFFEIKFKGEEIKYHSLGSEMELIYKGEAKID